MKLPEIKKRQVYLDHAATTPVDARVVAAMQPFFTEQFGNPGGLYKSGRAAAEAVASARQRIAQNLNARPEEILFTSGGTESDNLAVAGILRHYSKIGKHAITTTIEHHAVLEPLEALRSEGFEFTAVPVDEFGCVTADAVIAALRPDTTLISIMTANNEIGTIQPIAEIGLALLHWKKEHGLGPLDPPFFHTDACQAVGALALDTQKLHVDLLTLNGSKIYGPKGIGVLFVKRGVQLRPLLFGGGQERRWRSGTENVPAIVGLATALDLVVADRAAENARLTELRDYFWTGLQTRLSKIVLNGHPTERLPNNLNVSVLDVEGEAVLLYLDEYGIEISTGSACTSTTLDPSHVILALGRPYEYAHGSLRFTLGHTTTRADIDYVLQVLPPVVEMLRAISPVNLSLEQKPEDLSAPGAFVGDGVPHWMKKI